MERDTQSDSNLDSNLNSAATRARTLSSRHGKLEEGCSLEFGDDY